MYCYSNSCCITSCIVPARKHVVYCVTVKVVTSCHILHCYSKICYKLCSRFKVCFNTFPCGWQYSLRTLTGYWMLADLAIWSLYSMFRTVHSVESLWTSHIITSSVPAVVVSPQQRSFRSRDGTVPVNLSLSHKQSVLEMPACSQFSARQNVQLSHMPHKHISQHASHKMSPSQQAVFPSWKLECMWSFLDGVLC